MAHPFDAHPDGIRFPRATRSTQTRPARVVMKLIHPDGTVAKEGQMFQGIHKVGKCPTCRPGGTPANPTPPAGAPSAT